MALGALSSRVCGSDACDGHNSNKLKQAESGLNPDFGGGAVYEPRRF